MFFFFVFFIIGLVTLFKGLKPLKLDLDLTEALIGSVILGFVGAGLGIILIRRVHLGAKDPSHRFSQVERIIRGTANSDGLRHRFCAWFQ